MKNFSLKMYALSYIDIDQRMIKVKVINIVIDRAMKANFLNLICFASDSAFAAIVLIIAR